MTLRSPETVDASARYADMYDFAPVPYVSFDAQGRIVEINQKGGAMLGAEQTALLGRPFSTVVLLEDPAGFFAHVNDCVTRKESVTGEWSFVRSRDGARVTVTAISSPRTSDGVTLAMTVLLDVTAQREAEAEREAALEREQAARSALEQANRFKDEFLNIASHELRTPLSAVLGWANLIDRRKETDPVVKRGIEVILRSVRAQTRMVEDILDVARLGKGGLPLDSSDVDLVTIARQAVESVSPNAEGAKVTLSIEAPPELRVWGDADRLEQIIWNLLINALKFTPEGGRIVVAAERAGDKVVLRVTDTGCGIEPSNLGWIFDRFRQVSHGRSRTHGGLGLGLTLVRRLLVAQGGTVVAESAGLGHGSTFTVTLPALTAERAAVLEASRDDQGALVPPKTLSATRVLLIDDDPDALELSSEVLEGAGAIVSCASSANDAFEALRRHVPSCIVSDLGMPEEDGFSLLRRVRAMGGRLAHVPAVALTAYARPEDARDATEAGFDAHLAKPFQPQELIATVAQLVGANAAGSAE